MPMEVHGIRELTAKLGRLPVELKREIETALERDVELLEERARSNASFSSDIPGRISGKVNFGALRGGIEVRVSEFGYPHAGKARVFEGNGEAPSPFVHPTYGHEPYFAQESHPFLHPAAEEVEPEVMADISLAVERAFDA